MVYFQKGRGNFLVLTALLLLTGAEKLYASDESGMLMGGLLSIGNDGAAEAGENPAYLVFPRLSTPVTTAVRAQAEKARNVGVTSVAVDGAGQYLVSADAALAYHGLAAGRLAMGVALLDVRSPIVQELNLDTRAYNAAQNTDVLGKTTNRTNSYGGSFGLGYRLGEHDAVGVKLTYGASAVIDRSEQSFSTASIAFHSEAITQRYSNTLFGSLSYLHHTANRDFTVSIGNIGFEYAPESYSYSQAISNSGNVVSSQYESAAWINRRMLDPYLGLGTRQRIFADVHLFAELTAQSLLQYDAHETRRREAAPNIMMARNFSRQAGTAFAAGIGLAAGLGKSATLFAGFRAQKSASTKFYSDTDNLGREVKQENVLIGLASCGMSYRYTNLLLQGGISYLHEELEIRKQAAYSVATPEILSTSDVSITIDGYGLFFSVAAGF